MKEHVLRLPLVVLLLPVHPVFCQDSSVSGGVGGEVVLPCVYKDPVPQNVFWRINEATPVFDIISRQPSTSTQHRKYGGRVSSFPGEYSKGNFSVVLKDLRLDDAGIYECKIPNVNQFWKVRLQVSDRDAGEANKEGREVDPPGGAASSALPSVVLLFAVSLLMSF